MKSNIIAKILYISISILAFAFLINLSEANPQLTFSSDWHGGRRNTNADLEIGLSEEEEKRAPGWGKRAPGWGKRRPGWGKRTPGWGKRAPGWGKRDDSTDDSSLNELEEILLQNPISIQKLKNIISSNEV